MSNLRLAVVLLITLAGTQSVTGQIAPALPGAQSRPTRPSVGSQEGEEAERAAALPASASSLPATTPVITIHGLCTAGQNPAKDSKTDCKTIVTRADFEKLVNTLQPDKNTPMPPQLQKQLANQYPQILYMSQEARKRGLENDPHYQAVLRFTKMELLRMELQRSLEEQAGKISDSEIVAYYKENSNNFQQATMQRIFIPKARQTDSPKEGATPEETQKVREQSTAAMAKVADDLHARAAAGEDFDKLQKEAYDDSGVKATVPPTLNPNVRRTGLPASQASVFDLKPGELSPVINDSQGFFIYRMQSKITQPLADVKDDIRNTMHNQRLQALRLQMQNAVSSDLNKDYFGETQQAPPTGSGMRPSNRPRPTPPVVQPQQ